MKLKHTLASRKDTKPTITDTEIQKFKSIDESIYEIVLIYDADESFGIVKIGYHKTRNGKTWHANKPFPSFVPMPTVGSPVYLRIKNIEVVSTNKQQLQYELG